MDFSASTSLYFYSALLQGNAALIALVAVFIVYRKQYLDDSFDKVEKIIMDFLCKTMNVAANYKNIFNFEFYNDELCKNLGEEQKNKMKKLVEEPHWKDRFENLKEIDEQRKTLWEKAVKPIRLLFILLCISVVLLPLSDFIHVSRFLEAILFVIFVFSEILTLNKLYVFIKNQLN